MVPAWRRLMTLTIQNNIADELDTLLKAENGLRPGNEISRCGGGGKQVATEIRGRGELQAGGKRVGRAVVAEKSF